MSFIPGRIRGKVNVANAGDKWIDQQTAETPEAWKGFSLSIELGFFTSDTQVMDMTGFSAITVEIHDNAFKVRPALLTVPATDLNPALSKADWDAQVAYHCKVDIEEADMGLDLGTGDSKTFWIFVHGIKDGKRKALGGTTLILRESGVSTNPAGPNQGANLINGGAVYDGSGNYPVAVDIDRKYEWTKGANDTSIVNGTDTYTATQIFTTQGTTVTLTGTPGAAVTALLRYPIYPTLDEVESLINQRNGIRSADVYVNGSWKRTVGVSSTGDRVDQVEQI